MSEIFGSTNFGGHKVLGFYELKGRNLGSTNLTYVNIFGGENMLGVKIDGF